MDGSYRPTVGTREAKVELVLNRCHGTDYPPERKTLQLAPERSSGHGETVYALDVSAQWCGRSEFSFRAYPLHQALTHRHEMGLMRWL